jgi:sugar O-acyltransferase (sialic acid O-acetyltransferase NeuD family)
VIIGAGGLGREFLDVVEAINEIEFESEKPPRFEVLGFLDDRKPEYFEDQRSHIIGPISHLEKLDRGIQYVIAIGQVEVRKQIDEYASKLGFTASVLIHPRASLGKYEVIPNEGTVICANSSLTTNISLGRHVHVNLNCTIGHDSRIGSYVSINPGVNISGNVQVGDRVLIGTGSAILQGLSIGEGSTVGGSALVTKSIAENVIAVGIPAKSYNK